MENKVIVGHELDSLKKELSNYVSNFKRSIEDKEYFLVTNASARNLGWVDALRFFIEGWESYSSPIKNLILSSAYKINKSCPLALPLYFETLTCDVAKGIGRSRRISSKDLERELRKINDDFLSENFDLFMHALHHAGSTGTISVEGSNSDFGITVDEGYESVCKIDSFFEAYFPTQEILDCKIIVYEGAVIEVSQIHHILEKAYNTQQAVILICSSYSNDVSNTLLVNWENNKTNVIPFVLEDSIDSINEVKDISSIIGQTPINKNNGYSLANVDLDEMPSHGISFNASKNCLRIILDDKASKKCMVLRSRLNEKLLKEKELDVQNILRKRVSRFSSRKITARIPFPEVEKGILQDRCASLFTYFSACAKQGVVDMGSDYLVKWLPSFEAIKAIRAAESDKAAIDNIKAVIRLEE